MSAKVLIVEDELLIAMDVEAIVEDAGYLPCGIATSARQARDIAEREQPQIALVDLNLADGLTGPVIGRELAGMGVKVVFVTANPRLVADGVPGAIGVIEKPTDSRTIASLLDWLFANTDRDIPPPAALQPFYA